MGFAKKEKFQKSEISMEVGGWIQVSLRIFFFLENLPKISSIPSVCINSMHC